MTHEKQMSCEQKDSQVCIKPLLCLIQKDREDKPCQQGRSVPHTVLTCVCPSVRLACGRFCIIPSACNDQPVFMELCCRLFSYAPQLNKSLDQLWFISVVMLPMTTTYHVDPAMASNLTEPQRVII